MDPKTEIKHVTAIAVPYGIRNYKVCFVRYKHIDRSAGFPVLFMDVFTGQRQLSMTQLIYRNDRWCSAVDHRVVYLLPDVTTRFREATKAGNNSSDSSVCAIAN